MAMVDSTNVGFWNVKSGRLYLALIFCLTVFASASIKNSLSMAVACMVNSTVVAKISKKSKGIIHVTNSELENSSCKSMESIKEEYEGPFVWTPAEQGFIFGAFFVGGLIAILPFGWLSDRYSAKRMVTIQLFSSTVGCCIIPVTAWHGDYLGLSALRFIMGFFGQSVMQSVIASISAHWIPPTERSTVLALSTAGSQLSNIFGMPINAALCGSKKFLGGWPAIFYVNGMFGIITIIIWLVFVTNEPESNRYLRESEKIHIQKSLADQSLGKRKEMMKHVPWLKMLTSPVLMTCILCNFTGGFLNTIMMTYLPTYFKDALFIDLRNNGIFSALPFVSQWISKIVFAIISDYMKKMTTISHTLIAKCFNSVGTFGTSIFLISCAYMDCQRHFLAILFLCLTNGMYSSCLPGWHTSLICIAPAYTGLINSMGRFAGLVGSVLAPFVVSAIIEEGVFMDWKIVFFVIASVVCFSGLLFLIFGSAEIQEWARLSTSIKPINEDIALEMDNLNRNKTERKIII